MAQHIPTLGICLGGGIVSHALGAAIGPPDHGLHEFGYYKLKVTAEGRAEIPDGMVVTQSHYHGFGLPDGGAQGMGDDAAAQADAQGRDAPRHAGPDPGGLGGDEGKRPLCQSPASLGSLPP